MKKLSNWLPFIGILLLVSSCYNTPSDDDFTPGNLPESVRDFIFTNYSGYRLDNIHTEDICHDSLVLEVELEDGPGPDVDLYFSLDGTFLFAAKDISVNNLPEAVANAITTGFPSYVIDNNSDDLERFEFENGSVQFKVKLRPAVGSGSSLEVIFDANGTIICQDGSGSNGNDDNGGDDNGSGDDNSNNNGGNNNSGVPGSVSNYVSTNYPGYRISSAHNEDLCDHSIVLKVELEDGPGPDIDLYFKLSGEFLFAAIEISPANLPSAVKAAITSRFPGLDIEDDETERYEFPNGTIQYKVELERDSGSDIEVVFSANGDIVCRKD